MLSQFEVVISNFEIRYNDFFFQNLLYLNKRESPSPKIALFKIW